MPVLIAGIPPPIALATTFVPARRQLAGLFPDDFAISTNTPLFAPACGSFTYLGQSFGFGTAPEWTVTARNASGGTTLNYTSTLFKLSAATITGQAWTAASGALTLVDSLTEPSVTDLGGGQGKIVFGVGGGLRFSRSSAAPAAPFDASLTLSASVADGDGVAYASNPFSLASIGFTGGANQQRYGRLRMANVFGSASPLAMQLEAQYWSGSSWVKNSGDSCTTLSGIFSSAPLGWTWPATAPASSATMAAGGGRLYISGPVSGTVVVTASGVPAWLASKWNGSANYDKSPSATATLGVQAPETRRAVHVREVH